MGSEMCIRDRKEALDSGTKYDYVINDLSEFSIDKDIHGLYFLENLL